MITKQERTLIKLYYSLLEQNHKLVLEHSKRTAILATRIAKALFKDTKAAFLAATFHDTGKLCLASDLFQGQNITPQEYETIKQHPLFGYNALYGILKFTALCSGLHHNTYNKGYGIDTKGIDFQPATVKKILEIATIVSIADFIDAFLTRKTTMLDGHPQDLEQALLTKFKDDKIIIDIALQKAKGIYAQSKEI